MIPNIQPLFLPLLKLLSDGKEHKLRDIVEALAAEFQVTDKAIPFKDQPTNPFYVLGVYFPIKALSFSHTTTRNNLVIQRIIRNYIPYCSGVSVTINKKQPANKKALPLCIISCYL
jgi:hypothetical protein